MCCGSATATDVSPWSWQRSSSSAGASRRDADAVPDPGHGEFPCRQRECRNERRLPRIDVTRDRRRRSARRLPCRPWLVVRRPGGRVWHRAGQRVRLPPAQAPPVVLVAGTWPDRAPARRMRRRKLSSVRCRTPRGTEPLTRECHRAPNPLQVEVVGSYTGARFPFVQKSLLRACLRRMAGRHLGNH